jgi:hypothetical protein
VQPTSTRWNSSTRAAATAIEFWKDLIEEDLNFSKDEMMALTEFVVVTAPFCWATTVLLTPNAEFVVYWAQSKKTTPFRPLTTDTEWRFTAPPGI